MSTEPDRHRPQEPSVDDITGLFNNASVSLQSLPATKTAFGDLTYDDIVDLMASVPDEVYAEGNCRFFMSNNLLWLLAKLKDGNGRPIQQRSEATCRVCAPG